MAEKSLETNVKNMITSLLTSTPLTCTIRQLKMDYRNMIGEDIPHRKLGYNYLEEFLLSISDTVQVCGQGPNAVVKPVVSQKSAHINELVMKQKVTTKRKRPKYSMHTTRYSHAPRFSTQKIVYPKPQTFSKTETKCETFSDLQDNEVNYNESSVVSESALSPSGKPHYTDSLQNSRNVSEKVPQTYYTHTDSNNSANVSKAQDLTDVSRQFFDLFSPGNSGSVGRSDSVVNQKTGDYSLNRTFQDILHSVSLNGNRIESECSTNVGHGEILNTLSSKNDTNVIKSYTTENISFNRSFQDIFNSSKLEFGNDVCHGQISNTLSDKFNANISSNTTQFGEPSEAFRTNNQDSNTFWDVAQPKNNEWQYLSCVRTNERTETKENISYVREDYSISDQEKHNRFQNTEGKLKRNVSRSDGKEDITVQIPREIQNNLKTLISLYPEGLWCGQLPTEYFKKFKKELNYEAYEYKSLIAMCMDLPDIFHYVRPSKEDFKLYDRSRPLPKEAEKTFTMASYSVKKPSHVIEKALPDLQSVLFADYLPSDIVINEVIPRQFLDEDVKEGDYLDIGVAEIFDLSKFWVYLSANGLDELMDDMQPFYHDNRNKYAIPTAFIKEGLYCVAKFYKEYHRAVIVKVFEDRPLVTLFYIDYGTVCKTSKNKLYFLVKQFGKLPFQSIRSRLANIYPSYENTTWSQGDIKIFYDLISKRKITAQVNKILHDKQILDLYLIDRETNECINDTLVKEKVALYTNQERPKSVMNIGYKPVVKYLHLFPSFPDIEFGIVPSVAEFTELSDQGVTYDHLYPEYFYRANCEENICEIEREHDLAIERAKEKYRKDCLFPKLTAHNVREIQTSQMLDSSIFGCIEDDIKDFMRDKMSSYNYGAIDSLGMPVKKSKTKRSSRFAKLGKKASEDIIRSEKGIQVEDSDYFKEDGYAKYQKRTVPELDVKDNLKKDDECTSYYNSTIDTDIDDENLVSEDSDGSFTTQISKNSTTSEKHDALNVNSLLASLEEDVLKDRNSKNADVISENRRREDVSSRCESQVSDLITFDDSSEEKVEGNADVAKNKDTFDEERGRNPSTSSIMIPERMTKRSIPSQENDMPKIRPTNMQTPNENLTSKNQTTCKVPPNTFGNVNAPSFVPGMLAVNKNLPGQQNETLAYQTWSDPGIEPQNISLPPGFSRNTQPLNQSNVYYPWSDPSMNQSQQSASGFSQPNPAGRFVPPPPGFYPPSATRPMYTPSMYASAVSLIQPQPILVFSNPTFLVPESASDFFAIYNNNLIADLGRALPHHSSLQRPQ